MAAKEYVGSVDLLLMFQLLKTEFDKYVQAVQGKGLSTEDFTTAMMNKLAGIEAGAEVNVQADWSETNSGSDAYIAHKPDLTVFAPKASPMFTGSPAAPTPTDSSSPLQIANVAYVTAAIAAALAEVTGIEFDAGTDGLGYTSLSDLQKRHPTGEAGTIYLVQNGGSAPNAKDEYFWNSVSTSYELFGSTEIDLSNYLQTTDVVEISSADVTAAFNSVFGSTT